MSDPFIGEIKIVAFNFPPRNWANCDGQLMAIAQNTALFSLIGTYYGGDGISTFALPDLRGRFPMHAGYGPGLTGRTIGQGGGAESNTMTINNLPPHNHGGQVVVSTAEGDRTNPAGAYPARPEEPVQPYAGSGDTTMAAGSVQTDNVGSGLPVNNMPPYRVLNFVIALAGIYPSRN